jgi:nitric oxide reductase activation protein
MSSARKIEQAREMCIILSEAVRKVAGVHLHIYGHTANQNGRSDLTLFEHYSSTSSAENADLGALGHIRAYSNNYDGYAIKETAKLLNQDPAKRKYLFVIADGLPHGNGYCGDEAEKHVASVCSFVRTRLKIPTYAFAVGVSLSDRSTFEGQYGKNNVLFLAQVSQCLPQITRFLRNALQKEKTLVDVSTD